MNFFKLEPSVLGSVEGETLTRNIFILGNPLGLFLDLSMIAADSESPELH